MNKILVTRSSMPALDEYIDEIRELWDTHWLTNMGLKHQQLQDMLCDYLNVPNVELVTNGHMALELSLQTLNISCVGNVLESGSAFKQKEVITTPFTFASTTHAIIRSGLRPVFCDINPEDFTINADKIEELITENTVAILPVHVYGNICNVEKIQKIANKYNLKVVYDAAHAFGETYLGRGVGAFGDISCFSFHATKVFNTVEGGAICFSNNKFSKKISSLKDFGILNEEEVGLIGTNAKMNEFCAAMGICNLRHIDDEIKKRKNVAHMYDERLSGISGIRFRTVQEGVKSNYSYYPIQIEVDEYGMDRDELHNKLLKNGISTRKYFYPLTSDFSCYSDSYDSMKTPVAYEASRKVLTLPMYADLSESCIENICDVIAEARRNS